MPRDILEHSAAGQPATLTSLPGPLRTLPRVKARIVEFGIRVRPMSASHSSRATSRRSAAVAELVLATLAEDRRATTPGP